MAQVAWAFVCGIAMLAIDGQLPAARSGALDNFLQFSSQLLIEGFVRDAKAETLNANG